jgi:hypothetical protein
MYIVVLSFNTALRRANRFNERHFGFALIYPFSRFIICVSFGRPDTDMITLVVLLCRSDTFTRKLKPTIV